MSFKLHGIDFASNGAWDVHIKKVINNGRKMVNQLHSVISNPLAAALSVSKTMGGTNAALRPPRR